MLFIVSCEKEVVTPTKEFSLSRTRIDTTIVGERQGLYAISTIITQEKLDPTKVYGWKVISKTTPDDKWKYSICDLNACYYPLVKEGEFKFIEKQGEFIVDWANYNSPDTDAAGNFIEPLSTGTCSISILFYPKEGGDTITFESTMQVVK